MNNEIMKNRHNDLIELVVYLPEKPKAVLVIAHGASEHINRYDHFAMFLQANDIAVYGYNHLGHGPLRQCDDVYFAAENGDKLLVSNLEDVCLYAYQRHSDLPIILMGHSMGSLITRALAIDTKLMLDGIIICGSLHPKTSLVKSGKTMAKITSKILGPKRSSKALNKVAFGDLEKTISFNQENVSYYKQDQDCGMLFTNSAIVDLMSIIEKVIDPYKISKMLRTNYLIISGKNDPFSKQTDDLYSFLDLLNHHKFMYTYKFYQGMMHEILNEDDRELVYQDILNYIQNRIENKRI